MTNNFEEHIAKVEKKINQVWAKDFVKNHNRDKYNRKHVCPILRMNMLRTFYYEIITEPNPTFKDIRFLLDKALVVNQHIIKQFKKHMYKIHPDYFKKDKQVFPEYYDMFNPNYISEVMKKVEKEIKEIKGYNLFSVDNYQSYYNMICFPKNNEELFNLKDTYAEILALMKTIKPEKEILVFDYIIDNMEYGYFIGELVSKGINDIRNRFGLKVSEGSKRETARRRKKFRLGMEIRAVELAKNLNKYDKDKMKELIVEYKI